MEKLVFQPLFDLCVTVLTELLSGFMSVKICVGIVTLTAFIYAAMIKLLHNRAGYSGLLYEI